MRGCRQHAFHRRLSNRPLRRALATSAPARSMSPESERSCEVRASSGSRRTEIRLRREASTAQPLPQEPCLDSIARPLGLEPSRTQAGRGLTVNFVCGALREHMLEGALRPAPRPLGLEPSELTASAARHHRLRLSADLVWRLGPRGGSRLEALFAEHERAVPGKLGRYPPAGRRSTDLRRPVPLTESRAKAPGHIARRHPADGTATLKAPLADGGGVFEARAPEV